jgi:Zn ribbon nucleic-acid-binding protein
VSETIWASIKTDWHADAICGGAADYLFFPSEETEARLIRVRSLFCDLCPVRAKCLNSALINGDSGFWGGTSTSMRNAMLRTRHRAKCPACKSPNLIDTWDDPPYQVCIACAASWRSDLRPVEAAS